VQAYEGREQVARFLASATPQLCAHVQRTGQLPKQYPDSILAHGISVAFELALVLALFALLVSLAVVRARASDIDAAAIPGGACMSVPSSVRRPRSARRSPVGDARRRQLIETAQQLIVEKGFKGLRIRDVADRSVSTTPP
jgi:hypothetical protein